MPPGASDGRGESHCWQLAVELMAVLIFRDFSFYLYLNELFPEVTEKTKKQPN